MTDREQRAQEVARAVTDRWILATPHDRNERQRLIDAITSALLSFSDPEGWQPIETAPHGKKIIAGYFNEHGLWRTITACYFPSNTLHADDDSDDEFSPEGWYEESETHENLLPCIPPTHWRPLPAAPQPDRLQP